MGTLHLDAHVDGSFNNATGKYGSGVVLCGGPEMIVRYCGGNDPKLTPLRNVAGEINAAIIAINVARNIFHDDIASITIFHDYEGISKWPQGHWKAKNEVTQSYRDFIQELPFPVHFTKVVAHSGDFYNTTADKLAKMGAGIEV